MQQDEHTTELSVQFDMTEFFAMMERAAEQATSRRDGRRRAGELCRPRHLAESVAAIGPNPLDPSTRPAVFDAARAQAARCAGEIERFWN